MGGLSQSPPARVVWIEIAGAGWPVGTDESPPARVVWIEICGDLSGVGIVSSPPARVVWIEIYLPAGMVGKSPVATREGGVD